MQSKLNMYRKISEDMIKALNDDEYDLFDNYLEQRQNIIDSILDQKLINRFKSLYNEEKIFMLDREIKEKLDFILNDTKREIREYKSKIQGNNVYSNIKKENFNIFYKKV